MDFFRRQNWDIVGKAWLWLGISAFVITLGMVWWATHGLNYGIDFTGGVLLRYQFESPMLAGRSEEREVLRDLRQMLQEHNLGSSQLQISGNDQLYIRIPEINAEGRNSEGGTAALEAELHAGFQEALGDRYGQVTLIGRETVGPIVGEQLRQSAMWALILGMALMLIFITMRYEFRFAVAAIAGLLHDILILVAIMALLRVELDSAFVAAILTVVGYSINDTIIVFDRIRENRKLHRGADFNATVNASLLQTLTRSINTTFTTLLTLTALYVLGGTTIRGFALALIVGVGTGAYSSIFTSSPIISLWYARSRRLAQRSRAARPARAGSSRAETQQQRAAQSEADVETDEAEDEAAAGRPSVSETMRQAEAKAREDKRKERRQRRKKKPSGGRKRF